MEDECIYHRQMGIIVSLFKPRALVLSGQSIHNGGYKHDDDQDREVRANRVSADLGQD